MWPFRTRFSLKDSGIFDGFTDWHSHLLPGVDDGVQTMEESLQILSLYEELGVREVWLTPHIMEYMPHNTEHLRVRFSELKTTYQGNVILHLAAENMLDNLFEERLEKNDLLPLGRERKHLLVETSYFSPPMDLNNILIRITSKGYIPVLAHPERYGYMNKDDYRELKRMGVEFQSNLLSLVGVYGPEVRSKAEWLLKNKYYRFCGSDIHGLSSWDRAIRNKTISEKVSRMLILGFLVNPECLKVPNGSFRNCFEFVMRTSYFVVIANAVKQSRKYAW